MLVIVIVIVKVIVVLIVVVIAVLIVASGRVLSSEDKKIKVVGTGIAFFFFGSAHGAIGLLLILSIQ